MFCSFLHIPTVVIHLVSAFVMWVFQMVFFVLDKREVYGTRFPRELSQGVRMGHVAAITTEPLRLLTYFIQSGLSPPVSFCSWGDF